MSAAIRVLIVEDEFAIARVLERSLLRRGLAAVIAGDGQAAISALERERFDFILCDYQLPDMTGEQVCRHAREATGHEQTPIAFCTAKAFEIDVERAAADLGLTDVFIKPFSVSRISDSIVAAVAANASPAL